MSYENSDTIIQFGKYNVSPDISFNILAYIVWKISPFIAYREIRFSPTILPQGINLKFLNLHSLLPSFKFLSFIVSEICFDTTDVPVRTDGLHYNIPPAFKRGDNESDQDTPQLVPITRVVKR